MHINDLLYCSDEQFLMNCYQILLGRAPDEEGFAHHLSKLRLGRPRSYVIRGIMRSREGRMRNMKVVGLSTALFWSYVRQLPGLKQIAAHLEWAGSSSGLLARTRAVEDLLTRLLERAENDQGEVQKVYRPVSHDQVSLDTLPPRAKEIFHELVG